MFSLVPIILTFLGLAGIVFIFIKRWDEFKNVDSGQEKLKIIEGTENFIHNLKNSFDSGSAELESKFSKLSEKSLRKIKILVARIDAYLSKKLESLRADKNKVFQESILDEIDKETAAPPQVKEEILDVKKVAKEHQGAKINKSG